MKRSCLLLKDASGSVVTMILILMFVFVGLLAVVIDLGHLHTVQNELRNAADSCALRGARSFLPDSIPISGLPVQETPDPDRAKVQAQLTIGDNKSDDNLFAQVPLTNLPIDEMEVGIWYYKSAENPNPGDPLQPWAWPPPSSEWGKYIGPGIRLPVKRDASHNRGPVRMTLAQILGRDTVPVTNVRATAALSGVGGFVPGSPSVPFGPMKQYLPENPGGVFHGTFRNDGSDTFGWSNLNPADTNPNANELKTILNQGALYDCPPGSTVGINNGVIASAIQAMTKQHPLNRFGLIDPNGDGVYEPSTEINPATSPPVSYAETVYMLPIYDAIKDSDKFNQSALVGAVPVQLVHVATSPNNYIDVRIMSGPWVAEAYGGGAWYGVLATEPKLVQ